VQEKEEEKVKRRKASEREILLLLYIALCDHNEKIIFSFFLSSPLLSLQQIFPRSFPNFTKINFFRGSRRAREEKEAESTHSEESHSP
jgi:hypothetical protein